LHTRRQEADDGMDRNYAGPDVAQEIDGLARFRSAVLRVLVESGIALPADQEQRGTPGFPVAPRRPCSRA